MVWFLFQIYGSFNIASDNLSDNQFNFTEN